MLYAVACFQMRFHDMFLNYKSTDVFRLSLLRLFRPPAQESLGLGAIEESPTRILLPVSPVDHAKLEWIPHLAQQVQTGGLVVVTFRQHVIRHDVKGFGTLPALAREPELTGTTSIEHGRPSPEPTCSVPIPAMPAPVCTSVRSRRFDHVETKRSDTEMGIVSTQCLGLDLADPMRGQHDFRLIRTSWTTNRDLPEPESVRLLPAETHRSHGNGLVDGQLVVSDMVRRCVTETRGIDRAGLADPVNTVTRARLEDVVTPDDIVVVNDPEVVAKRLRYRSIVYHAVYRRLRGVQEMVDGRNVSAVEHLEPPLPIGNFLRSTLDVRVDREKIRSQNCVSLLDEVEELLPPDFAVDAGLKDVHRSDGVVARCEENEGKVDRMSAALLTR